MELQAEDSVTQIEQTRAGILLDLFAAAAQQLEVVLPLVDRHRGERACLGGGAQLAAVFFLV